MALHGVPPDAVSVNTALAALARRGLASDAVALFAERFGPARLLPPRADANAGADAAAGEAAQFRGGQPLREPHAIAASAMGRCFLEPTAVSYSALLWALARAGHPHAAPAFTAALDSPPGRRRRRRRADNSL